MNYEDRLELFKDELDLLMKEEVKEFTKACIKHAPDYVFHDCPSSSTGKYHPIEELGPDGTIIHTKKVFALAYELSRGLDCENHRDEICAAALLHDLAKQGEVRVGTTIREHPQIMAGIVSKVYNNGFRDKINKESFLIIYHGVFYHYGPWTEESVKKPLYKFSHEELAVYLADYVCSKRFVHVEYKRK